MHSHVLQQKATKWLYSCSHLFRSVPTLWMLDNSLHSMLWAIQCTLSYLCLAMHEGLPILIVLAHDACISIDAKVQAVVALSVAWLLLPLVEKLICCKSSDLPIIASVYIYQTVFFMYVLFWVHHLKVPPLCKHSNLILFIYLFIVFPN